MRSTRNPGSGPIPITRYVPAKIRKAVSKPLLSHWEIVGPQWFPVRYSSKLPPLIERAGEWFLRSGIQDPNGGVARFYRTDLQHNAPVSTEITGYALSTLVWMGHLDRARTTADFLCGVWDAGRGAMQFDRSGIC